MNLLLGFTLPYDGCKTGALAVKPDGPLESASLAAVWGSGRGTGYFEVDFKKVLRHEHLQCDLLRNSISNNGSK